MKNAFYYDSNNDPNHTQHSVKGLVLKTSCCQGSCNTSKSRHFSSPCTAQQLYELQQQPVLKNSTDDVFVGSGHMTNNHQSNHCQNLHLSHSCNSTNMNRSTDSKFFVVKPVLNRTNSRSDDHCCVTSQHRKCHITRDFANNSNANQIRVIE